jgi:hypothetical protein
MKHVYKLQQPKRKCLNTTPIQIKLTNMGSEIASKYYEKQAVGFCNFLASIGAVQNPDQCVLLQMLYMMSKDAFGKWYANRALSGGAPARQVQKAVNNVVAIKIPRNSLQSMDYSALNNVIVPNYAYNVKGNKQLEYVRAIASSKGCSI